MLFSLLYFAHHFVAVGVHTFVFAVLVQNFHFGHVHVAADVPDDLLQLVILYEVLSGHESQQTIATIL